MSAAPYRWSFTAISLSLCCLVHLGSTSPDDGANFGDALRYISSAEWEDALKQPNATGQLPFSGIPDISKPWPAQEKSDPNSWTLSIAVKADIPVPASWTNQTTAGYTTGTQVSIIPPQHLLKKLENGTTAIQYDPDWTACFYFVSNVTGGAFHNGSTTDFSPSCEKQLGDSCVTELQQQLVAAESRSLTPNGTLLSCPWPVLPASCQPGLVNNGSDGIELGATFAWTPNFTDINGASTLNVASERHELGNLRPYSDAIHNGWLVFAMFIYQNLTKGEQNSNETHTILPPLTQLACIRPDTVEAGSQFPSTTTRTPVAASLALLSATVAAFFLAL